MLRLLVVSVCMFCSLTAYGRPYDFALKLCKSEPQKYECRKVEVPKVRKIKYFTWEEFFKKRSRLAKAVNRRNTLIWHNHYVAIPKFDEYMDYSPFPKNTNILERYVVVDLNVLAWGAYDSGKLINWGPANGGSKRCKETGLPKCKTHSGEHVILRIGNYGTKSQLYPTDCVDKKACGFQMFYYMKFHTDGTGLHGAKSLPGWNASHGCVRLLKEDARWLNKKFVSLGMKVYVVNY